jgi:AcrR family transcriptional regulator
MSDAGKRGYRMVARAEAKAATRERILEAAVAVGEEVPFGEVTLKAVAERAGVSVQTVLRHFGSSDDLFVAAVVHMGTQMAGDRDVEPDWPLERIVGVLVDHYERFGERILRMLGQEERHPQIKAFTDLGRTYHAQWCADAFAPALAPLRGARRERRLSQLIVATDLYTWKILRLDRGLPPAEVKRAIRELIEPLALSQP